MAANIAAGEASSMKKTASGDGAVRKKRKVMTTQLKAAHRNALDSRSAVGLPTRSVSAESTAQDMTAMPYPRI